MLVDAIEGITKFHFEPDLMDSLVEIFMAISEMNPEYEELSRLASMEFLPVQLPNGDLKLVKPLYNFSVVDRTGYGEAFEGKAELLYLSPTEVHSCRKLLIGLGLLNKLMSKAVTETTTAEHGIPNPGLTRNFQLKAYALFRYVYTIIFL